MSLLLKRADGLSVFCEIHVSGKNLVRECWTQILSAKQTAQFFIIEEYLKNGLVFWLHFLLFGLASLWFTYWVSFSCWRVLEFIRYA